MPIRLKVAFVTVGALAVGLVLVAALVTAFPGG